MSSNNETNSKGCHVRLAVRIVGGKGKISRLPYAVRAEIDRRISRGQPVAPILSWLNSHPAVHERLWRHFGGAPITLENLNEWRRRGRRDVDRMQWLAPRLGKKRGRKSKIDRFPDLIRNGVNHRLRDGYTGEEILAWLNSRPAARIVLINFFGGRPVNQENLCHYRHNGYSEWLAQTLASGTNV